MAAPVDSVNRDYRFLCLHTEIRPQMVSQYITQDAREDVDPPTHTR